MARERELKVKLLGDASGAKKAFRELDDAADKSESKLSKASGAIKGLFGAAVAAGAAGAAKAMFNLGARLEQIGEKANAVFGPAAIEQVEKWADSNANAMGLTSNEAIALATNLADLLKPMGFTADQAAEMSTRVVGLSGALSVWSAGSKSASEVAEILTAAMLGERDALKGLGVSIDAAEVETRLLEKGQKNLTGAARQQAEAMATVELIFAKTTDAQAAFSDSTQTTNERIAEQSAKFRELQERVGEFVHGALNDYATWALGGEGDQINEFWRDYNAGIDEIVISLSDLSTKLKASITDSNALTTAWHGLMGVGGELYDLWHGLTTEGTTNTTPPAGVSTPSPSPIAPPPGVSEGPMTGSVRAQSTGTTVNLNGDIVMSEAMSANQFMQQLADTVAIATRMG